MTKLFYKLSLLSLLTYGTGAASLESGSLRKSRHDQNRDLSEDDVLQGYTIEATRDLVTNLPGLTFEPGFKQFSGYIPVSPTRFIHYWYIESANNPSTDPLVWWSNGGPGCSGLLGLGTEMGPFIFEADGSLTPNPHTWNKVANILYVEQPAGVGFSYFSDPSDAAVGDERAAVDNYELLKQFFKRFPERLSNELYIASESYGGHYIPHLAKEIMDRNEGDMNFRGFLVGNPYVDPFSNDVTMIQTYYMHGLIAWPLYKKWEKHCTDPNDYPEDKCGIIINAMFQESGDGINPYALDFPVCTELDNDDYPPPMKSSQFIVNQENTLHEGETTSTSRRKLIGNSSQSSKLLQHTSVLNPPYLPSEDKYHPCAESHLNHYLNRDDVKKALHVKLDRKWNMCTDDIDYSEEDSATPQMDLYQELLHRAQSDGSNLKMLVFSGDDDSVCSTAATQYWIYDVGVSPKDDALWVPWKFENQTAGYVTDFDMGTSSGSSFVFATVHGAGHEVPAYRPAEALALFKSFLSGEWDTN